MSPASRSPIEAPCPSAQISAGPSADSAFQVPPDASAGPIASVRTLIFDWDGTLHNTKHLYGCAFRTAYRWLVSEGYAAPRDYSDDDVSVYLGMSAPVMWDTFMPDLPRTVKEHCSSMIGEQMVASVLSGDAVLYPGVPEVLDTLCSHGFHLVFLSNCKHAYMEAHRQVFRLDQWFEGFYCSGDFAFLPKEQIFPVIRQAFPGGYAVIGDRASDLEIARVHGLPSVGCAYGFGTPEEMKLAAQVAQDVRELPRILV